MMHRTLLWCVRCGEPARKHSPDAGTVSLLRPVRCVRCSARHALGHRTLRPASGGHRPMIRSSAELSVFKSVGHRTRLVPHKERPVTPRTTHIICTPEVWLGSFFSSPRPRRALDTERIAAAVKFFGFSPVDSFSPAQFSSPKIPLSSLHRDSLLSHEFKGLG